MKRHVLSITLACAFGLLLAGSAQAQPRIQPPGGPGPGPGQPQQPSAPAGGILSGTTVELTARMLQEAGYADVQIFEHQGTRHVRAKAGETPVIVFHDSCKDNACLVITYGVFFGEQRTIDANYMNAWNSQQRWCKLYRGPNNTLMFTMDVFVAGVIPDYLKATSTIFAGQLKRLFEFRPS